MNYKAELRGFALDRAIRIAEVNKEFKEDVLTTADKIVDYLYIPDKDIKGLLDTVLPLIVQSGDVNKIGDMILDLQQIEAELKAGVVKPNVQAS